MNVETYQVCLIKAIHTVVFIELVISFFVYLTSAGFTYQYEIMENIQWVT